MCSLGETQSNVHFVCLASSRCRCTSEPLLLVSFCLSTLPPSNSFASNEYNLVPILDYFFKRTIDLCNQYEFTVQSALPFKEFILLNMPLQYFHSLSPAPWSLASCLSPLQCFSMIFKEVDSFSDEHCSLGRDRGQSAVSISELLGDKTGWNFGFRTLNVITTSCLIFSHVQMLVHSSIPSKLTKRWKFYAKETGCRKFEECVRKLEYRLCFLTWRMVASRNTHLFDSIFDPWMAFTLNFISFLFYTHNHPLKFGITCCSLECL